MRCVARALVAARRDEVPLASYSGWCFQRFTPRGHWWLRGGPKFRWRGGLQRVVLSPLYAARFAALARGPRGAAAAFLASLMRR